MTNSVACPNCGDEVRGRFCTSCGTRSDGSPSSGNLNTALNRDPDKTSMMNSSVLQDLLAQPNAGRVAAQTQVMPEGFGSTSGTDAPDADPWALAAGEAGRDDPALATDALRRDDPSLMTDVLPRDAAALVTDSAPEAPAEKPGLLRRILFALFPTLMARRSQEPE